MGHTGLRFCMMRVSQTGVPALLAALGILGGAGSLVAPASVQARTAQTEFAAESVPVEQLPPQGRQVMALIYQGGPFQYDKDGVIFGNRERLLPVSPRGYYREYTVKTPYQRSRGARRIVCGGVKPVAPDNCYYTDDHYASFRKIVQ